MLRLLSRGSWFTLTRWFWSYAVDTSEVCLTTTGKRTEIASKFYILSHRMGLRFWKLHIERLYSKTTEPYCYYCPIFRAPIEITGFMHKGFSTFLLYLYTDRIEPFPNAAEDALGNDGVNCSLRKRACMYPINFKTLSHSIFQSYSGSQTTMERRIWKAVASNRLSF